MEGGRGEGGTEGGRGEGEKHELILFCEELSCKVPLANLKLVVASPSCTITCSLPNSRRRLLGHLALGSHPRVTQEHKAIQCMPRPLSWNTLLRLSRVSRSSRPAYINMYNSDQCTPVTRSSQPSASKQLFDAMYRFTSRPFSPLPLSIALGPLHVV